MAEVPLYEKYVKLNTLVLFRRSRREAPAAEFRGRAGYKTNIWDSFYVKKNGDDDNNETLPPQALDAENR